jgi:mannose-6-phosphate isomerase-like protein (cupin superfamily)
MARSGQVIENPATRERIVFRQTAQDTNGQLLEVETFIPAESWPLGWRRHFHPSQEERFEVLSGIGEFEVGKKRGVAREGEVVTVPPKVIHRFQNRSQDDLHLLVQLRPALRIEFMLEAMFSLGRAGRLTNRATPRNPLVAAVLARDFINEVVVAPALPYRAFAKLVAPISQSVGIRLNF